MHPSYAVINLSKLRYNFYNIRKKTKNVKIMAVVKADAYGHGMTETARFLNSLGKKAPEY
jgi:alanine racemase